MHRQEAAARHVGPGGAPVVRHQAARAHVLAARHLVLLQPGEGPVPGRVQVSDGRRLRIARRVPVYLRAVFVRTTQAGQVHPDGRAGHGDHGRDRIGGRPLRLPPRARHAVQLQHHGGRSALRRAQQIARLPEGLLGLVSRVRKVQNGHEVVGTEAAGE